MGKRVVLSGIVFFILFHVLGQKGTVIPVTQKNFLRLVNEKKKEEQFTLKTAALLELRNDRLNLAVNNDRNEMFQMTGIKAELLKDTTFKSSTVRLALTRVDRTYLSRPEIPVELKIVCSGTKPGNLVSIHLKSKVFYRKTFYNIEAQFSGKIPTKKFDRTNKN